MCRVNWFFLFFTSIFLKAEMSGQTHLLASRLEFVQQILQEFEPDIEKALADYQVPGLSIGVIVDGELVYAKGVGKRNVEEDLPATPNTLFGIGSCTKAFTSFLVGMSVDEGKVGWDTPIIDILPDLRLWDYDATFHLTLRDMLTHRSGLPRHGFAYYNSKVDRAELLKRLQYLEPVCRIRQKYLYNDLMYFAAAMGLERLYGKSWEQLTEEKIFSPLAMTHTNCSVEDMQRSDDYAIPYIEKEDRLQKMAFRDFSLMGPAGSINSNIWDLSAWVKMHLAHGNFDNLALMQSTTMQEMLIPQVITTGTPEAKDTNFSAYGIGWNITSYRGHYLVSHDGGIDGFTSVVAFLPQDQVGIVVLSNKNLTALPRLLSMEILDRILQLPQVGWLEDGLDGIKKTKETALEKKLRMDPSRKTGTSPSRNLEDFTGEYENPGYGSLKVDLIDGNLCVIFNEIPFILEHWHYDVFSVMDEPVPPIVSLEGTKFVFRHGVHGEIEELLVPFEPNIEDIVFKKKHTPINDGLRYLQKFVGLYEIYGYTVEILIRNGILCAIIPGQPVYEMVPSAENEFSVKSKTGYNVRFVLNQTGAVTEVLLMQPYGTFSATPKE